MFSLGQAAKEAGVAKSTISKAIKDGRISAEKFENGSYSIDPAELFRVFTRKQFNKTLNGPLETPTETVDLLFENRVMQRELELARLQLAECEQQLQRQSQKAEEDLKDARSERDQWRQQATMLLEDKRPQTGLLDRWAALFRRANT